VSDIWKRNSEERKMTQRIDEGIEKRGLEKVTNPPQQKLLVREKRRNLQRKPIVGI
jgi:hypothetical protein